MTIVEMKTFFDNLKFSLGGGLSGDEIGQLAALVFSFGLHCLLYFFLGSGIGQHGVGKSALSARSQLMFIQAAKSESASDSVAIKIVDLPAAIEEKKLVPQENHTVKTESGREQEVGRQDALAPIVLDAKPYYFRTEQLSIKPLIVHDVDLPFSPLLAPLKGQTAVLRLFLNEYGTIDDIIVEESPLPEVALEILKDTFAKMVFQPGVINGLPVRTEMVIEVSLEDIL